MSRWLGWLVIAGLATTARAETSSTTASNKRAPGKPGAADPLPPEVPAQEPKPKTVAIATARSELDPRDLRSLTNDRALARAGQVDGYETKGMVAFTFDDGPNPETTPDVIDALEKYDVPATFFIVTQRITGKRGAKGREILKRELEAGFQIGSHTVSHRNLKRATDDKLTREIDGSIKDLAAEAKRPIGLFRPPYGALGEAGRGRLKKLGLTEVLWSVDTLDWKAKDAERLRKKTVSMIKKDGGGVVLMHDVKPITAKIIAQVLDDLEAENCARLAHHKEPIVPVSLHYFLRDGKKPREIPAAVKQRTEAYRTRLPQRCAKRSRPASAEAEK